MRKHWSEKWRHDVEREFGASIAEILRGFLSDGESLASTASILEVCTRDLETWCAKNGIQFPLARKGQAAASGRAPSPTRSRSVRLARRASVRISFARLAEWYDQDRRAIRQRFARTGNILKALR